MKQSVFLTLLTPTLVFLNIISFCWFLILLFSSLKSLNLALFLFLPSKLNTPFWRTVLPFLAMLTDRFCFILTHLSTGFSFFYFSELESLPFPPAFVFSLFLFLSSPPLLGATTTRSSLQHILRNGSETKTSVILYTHAKQHGVLQNSELILDPSQHLRFWTSLFTTNEDSGNFKHPSKAYVKMIIFRLKI